MSFNRGGRDFAVVEADPALVAVLTSTRLPAEPSDLRHFRIVVHPDWRRRRLGSRLLDIVRSQDGDPTTLQCNCNRSWRAGTSFPARIDSLVVDPDHRERGIGRTLLTAALGALAGAGQGSIALGVRADNQRAIGLYESLGFTTVDEMVTWWLPRS